MLKPASRTARIAPIAIKSDAAKIASGLAPKSFCICLYPLASEKSPSAIKDSSISRPPFFKAFIYPTLRSIPTVVLDGPVIAPIRLYPSLIRWSTAIKAELMLSIFI